VAKLAGPRTATARWPGPFQCHVVRVSCDAGTPPPGTAGATPRAWAGDLNFLPPLPQQSRKRGRPVTSSSGHSAAEPRFTMEQKQAAQIELSDAAAAPAINSFLSTHPVSPRRPAPSPACHTKSRASLPPLGFVLVPPLSAPEPRGMEQFLVSSRSAPQEGLAGRNVIA
jgi:hypothetical protein